MKNTAVDLCQLLWQVLIDLDNSGTMLTWMWHVIVLLCCCIYRHDESLLCLSLKLQH